MNPTRSTPILAGIAALICLACVSGPVTAGDQAFAINPDDPELAWHPCPGFFPDGCGLAVLQGNPGARYSDVLLRLPPNSSIPEHTHTSAERMVLIAGEFHIHPRGQDSVIMREGTYAYGSARAPHSAECMDNGHCYLFIAFEEPVDAFPVWASLAGLWDDPETSGQGWTFQAAPNGFFGHFFGYSPAGNPIWLMTEQVIDDIELGQEVTYNLLHGVDGTFEQPVSPEDLELWGEVQFTFHSCEEATAVISGLDGSTTHVLQRVAPSADGLHACH
jgi:quercetin dioxygenase-like cupin family protein